MTTRKSFPHKKIVEKIKDKNPLRNKQKKTHHTKFETIGDEDVCHCCVQGG